MDNVNRLVAGFNRLLARQQGGKIKKEEKEVSKEDFINNIRQLQEKTWNQTQAK